MRKIYFLVSLALLTIFTACKDFNADNFPGSEQFGNPTNVAKYSYTLTDADYTTIANAVKKPVTDSITLMNAKLVIAKKDKKVDSVYIQSRLTALALKLTTDSVYIKASYIASNKFFNSKLKAMDYIPYLLSANYKFADNTSTIKVTSSIVNTGDTLTIPTDSKFTLVDADYVLMGTDLNQPGLKKNFSSTMPVMAYLNTYLKLKCPYAVANDIKLVKYLYYDTNKATLKLYRVLTFDGQNWSNVADQYMVKEKAWIYDPTITLALKQISGNNPYIMKFIDYLRANLTDKFYQKNTYTNEEHYYGFSAYYTEIIFTGDRTTYGDAAIKALKTNDEKYILFRNRFKEAMPLFTQLNFPNLKTDVSGVQQYVVISIMSYYSSSKAGLLTVKMKCIKSGSSSEPAAYEVESMVETF